MVSKIDFGNFLGYAKDIFFAFAPEFNLVFNLMIIGTSYIYFKSLNKKPNNFNKYKSQVFYSSSVLVLIFYIFFSFWQFIENGSDSFFICNSIFSFTPYVFFMKAVFGYIVFLIIQVYFSSKTSIAKDLENSKIFSFELIIVFLLMILGMVVCIQANNFITFYIALELQSFSIFILLFLGSNDNLIVVRTSIAYFLIVLVSSVLFLVGIAYFYWRFGTVEMNELWVLLYTFQSSLDFTFFDIFFAIIVSLSLFVKVGLFPAHLWVPLIYGFGNIFVTSLLATISKIFGFSILLKFLSILVIQHDLFFWLEFASLCAIVHGVFVALSQNLFKVLLGYSAIVHMGYVFLVISTNTPDGYAYAIFYVFVYIINILPVFLFLLGVKNRVDNSATFSKISDFSKIKLQTWKDICIFIMFSTFFFSFIGIPPFPGFFAKFFIIKYLIATGHYFSAFIMGLFSVVSAFYYLKIIKALFFSSERFLNKSKVDNYNYWTVSDLVSICIIFFGIFNILFVFFVPYILYIVFFFV